MKTIRSNCFETNSSSTHSITLLTTPKDLNQYAGILVNYRAECGEFGWEWETYIDTDKLISYVWTLAQEDQKLKDLMFEVAHITGLQLIEPGKDLWHGVDHGSEHWENAFEQNPALNTVSGLIEFFVRGEIKTGNDNG